MITTFFKYFFMNTGDLFSENLQYLFTVLFTVEHFDFKMFVEDSLKMPWSKLGVNWTKNVGGDGCLESCQLKAHTNVCSIRPASFKLYTIAVAPRSGLYPTKPAEEVCNKTWSVCDAWEGRFPGWNNNRKTIIIITITWQNESGFMHYPLNQ